MFHYLGLIVSLVVWLGIGFLVSKWREEKLGSISAHAASAKGANLLFRILLIGGGLLMYWWLVGWLKPHLNLPLSFTIIISIVTLYQILTALITDKPGPGKRVHQYTAHTMSLLYVPLAVLICDSPKLSLIARILCIGLTAYMVNTFILLQVMGVLKKKYLIFQSLYIVAFQLLILAAGYLS